MKFKDFVFSNSKKIIGSALLLSLMAVQTVGATGGITDSLKSKGNIEYDANGDGQADVYFYSKDLTTIAGGVEDINSNMAILSQSFTDLTAASNGYKSDIIAGLNSNVYAKNNIAADATFEDIISKINNIPAPTTATGNVWSGGDNSGIGITSNGQSVNIDGVTSLNLAVNESVTLPSGYYPNDITISNNVANRGSLSFNPSDKTTSTIQAGYYTGGSLSSSLAYDSGYGKGMSDGHQKGYDEGLQDGYKKITYSFFDNNLSSESATLFSISAFSSADGHIWDHNSSSANETVEIPLFTYNADGSIKQILNVVQLTPQTYSNGTVYGSATASSSCTYTLVSDTGTDLSSVGKVVNLFGQSGLTNATKLILNATAFCDANNGGVTQSNIRQATASFSYTAQYINIAN